MFYRKMVADATVGFDPERTLSLETFTFQEFMRLAQDDFLLGSSLMRDYCDAVGKEIGSGEGVSPAKKKGAKKLQQAFTINISETDKGVIRQMPSIQIITEAD